MTNYIIKQEPVWLETLSSGEAMTSVTLLSGDGEQVVVPAPLLPAASPLLRSVLADLPPLAYSPCFISLPYTLGSVLVAARDMLTTGIAAASDWKQIEQVKEVLRMLEVETSLMSCQLAKMGEGFGVREIVGNYSAGPDVDSNDMTHEFDITIKLEVKEAVSSPLRLWNSDEPKFTMRDCSVMLKRGKSPSLPLSQIDDQLLTQDVTIPALEVGEVEDSTENVGLHEENLNIIFQCPKCGKGYKKDEKNGLRFHILSHYYKEFFKVLPSCKPYPCPICGKSNYNRVAMVRHYAFKHKMMFQMTNLTPAGLKGIPVIDDIASTHQQLILDKIVSQSEYFKTHLSVIRLWKDNSQGLEVDENLPAGWKIKVYARNSGDRIDKKNIVYITPENIYLRTKFGAIEYMRLLGNYTMEEVERVAGYLRVKHYS